MARPLRIEFAGAWYHVMNRGAGHRVIFPSDRLRRSFLQLLDETYERHGLEIHAWCLMDNHYHLVVRTPEPNLGRAMRHIDGVYAQRHNRAQDTDGPLFRGRYNAIIVDSDAYLAQLSRYVHRNPLEAGLVASCGDWRWSSYKFYVSRVALPRWQRVDEVLGSFGTRTKRQHYVRFVNAGIDPEIQAFYARSRRSPVLGSDEFIWRLEGLIESPDDREVPDGRRLRPRPEIDAIVVAVAQEFSVTQEEILVSRPGRVNPARAVAMLLCQSPGGYPLSTIGSKFGMRSYSGVAMAIRRLKGSRQDPKLRATIEHLKRELFTLVCSEDLTP